MKGFVADGHLAFLHGLQQGALYFGRGAVDLVGEDKIGEHRAFADGEFRPGRVVDHRTDHVGGQQVGGKLDAAEFGVHRLGQGFDGQGFGQTGHAFQQDMAFGKQPDQQAFQHILLPDDDLGGFGGELFHEGTFGVDAVVERLDVDVVLHKIRPASRPARIWCLNKMPGSEIQPARGKNRGSKTVRRSLIRRKFFSAG